MAHNRNVSFIKPSEPSFLKAFKTKVGYKEPDNVDTKRQSSAKDERSDKDRFIEDELPTIAGGDVTEEEYKEYVKEQFEEAERNPKPHPEPTSQVLPTQVNEATPPKNSSGTRIVFKKRKKRSSSEASVGVDSDSAHKGGGGLYSSSKRKTSDSDKKVATSNKPSRKGVKNLGLLSFDDNKET